MIHSMRGTVAGRRRRFTLNVHVDHVAPLVFEQSPSGAQEPLE